MRTREQLSFKQVHPIQPYAATPFGNTKRRTVTEAAIALVAAVVISPWAAQNPGGLIRDDGFFYAQIAYNLAAHHSSSFDLINPTDGYHSLWALILAATSAVLLPFTQAKSIHLIAYIAVNLFVILLTIRLLALRGLAAFAYFCLLLSCSLLMEGHLALLLCVLVMRGMETSVARNCVQPGMLIALALLPFSRIDAALLGAFLVGGAAVMARWRLMRAMAGALVVGIGFHFAYQRVMHGSFFTVSSELKTHGNEGPLGQLLTNMRWGAETVGLPIPVGPSFAVFLLLGIGSAALWLTSPALRGRKELLALWLGALVFTAGHACFNTLRPWYFTLSYGVFGYTVLTGISALTVVRRRAAGAVAAAVMILPTAALGYLGVRQRDEARDVRQFVHAVESNVPVGEPIYMVDGSGYLGWTVDRPIVNGDGLVNSHGFATRLLDDDLDGYLKESGIRFFITNKVAADSPVLIDYGGLVVRRDEAVLITEKQGGYRYFYTQFILWQVLESSGSGAEQPRGAS